MGVKVNFIVSAIHTARKRSTATLVTVIAITNFIKAMTHVIGINPNYRTSLHTLNQKPKQVPPQYLARSCFVIFATIHLTIPAE